MKQLIARYLYFRSLKNDKSKFGWRESPKYTEYYQRCREKFDNHNSLFDRDQIAWTNLDNYESAMLRSLPDHNWRGSSDLKQLLNGAIGDFITATIGCEFKVATARVVEKDSNASFKNWHSDADPGTQFNVFCYISDGYFHNGPTTLLPWPESVKILKAEHRHLNLDRLSKQEQIKRKARFYGEEIRRRRFMHVTPQGPSGLIVIFNNNVLHYAAPPHTGYSRKVLILEVYPSLKRIVTWPDNISKAPMPSFGDRY